MVSFTVQKLLSLIRSHFFIFAFISFALGEQSPTFLPPGIGFMEDNFSMDGGQGFVQAVMRVMVQAVMQAMVQVVMRAMRSDG